MRARASFFAGALAERDDLDDARTAYARAARDDPALLRASLGAALTLPMVAPDADAVARSREAYAVGLDARDELPARAAAMAAGACARRAALDQFPARLPGRGRSRAAGRVRRSRRRDLARRARTVARRREAAGERAARGLRLGVLPRRDRRPLFRVVDHRACRASASTSPSISSAAAATR
jgi:hypothetical protein